MRGLVVFASVVGLAPAPVRAATVAPLSESVPIPFGRFEVAAGPGARELSIEARFLAGAGDRLLLDDGVGRFVERPEQWRGGRWRPLRAEGDRLRVEGCRAQPCRIRYIFRLAAAARALQRHARAFEHGGALFAPPSTWLVRPDMEPPVRGRQRAHDGSETLWSRYRLHVRVPAGLDFVTGLFPLEGSPGTYAIDDLGVCPYSAFGAFETARVEAGGGAVEVAVAPGARALSREAIAAWVQRSAAAVASYYGRAPLRRSLVMVLPGSRRPVGYGTAMGSGGGSILVWIGAGATEADLLGSWVLVHEMVHLGFPNVPRAQRWLEEGLATYLEPVARVRAGLIGEEEFWRGLVRGLPNGLPRSGEQGLDFSPRWGTLYWGGALFWLLADVEIRTRTDNRRSLDDALRAVLAAGGSIAAWWPVDRIIEEGDRATGVPVLRDLYERMARESLPVDLPGLWRRLGVTVEEGAVRFDDAAPLAGLRRSIAGSADTPRLPALPLDTRLP